MLVQIIESIAAAVGGAFKVRNNGIRGIFDYFILADSKDI